MRIDKLTQQHYNVCTRGCRNDEATLKDDCCDGSVAFVEDGYAYHVFTSRFARNIIIIL
jgi:hypothetical protein